MLTTDIDFSTPSGTVPTQLICVKSFCSFLETYFIFNSLFFSSLLTKYFTAPALRSNPEMKSQFHSFFNHILICFVFSLHITVNIIFIYLFSQNAQSFPFPYYMGALMVRAQYKDSSTVLAAIKNIHYLVNGD